MELKAPEYIQKAEIIGCPISYKWNGEVAAELLEKENRKLQSAIEKSTFKAGFALGIALTEWIVWRLHGHTEILDAQNRIEAAWAAVVAPVYAKNLETELPEDEDFDEKEPIKAPLVAAVFKLGEMFNDYTSLNDTAPERIVVQALLARHLVPNKRSFEEWLSNSLRRATAAFPMELSHYNEATEQYDSSYEEPVPRELFESGYTYSEAKARVSLRSFLKTLDPKKNPYLRSPAEMKASGFKGTPYSV